MRGLPSHSALRWYSALKDARPRQGFGAPAPERFEAGGDVRIQIPMLESEHFSSAPETSRDLVLNPTGSCRKKDPCCGSSGKCNKIVTKLSL